MRFLGIISVILTMFLCATGAAIAQSSPAVMAERVEALERQLRLLQRRVSNGDVALPQASAATSGATDRQLLADLSARLGTLDRQIRQLNGRIEEFEYRQNELAETVDQMRNQLVAQRQQQLAGAVPNNQIAEAGQEGQSQPDPAGGEPLAALPVDPAPAVATVELPEGSASERYSFAFSFVRSNDLDSGRIAMEKFLAAHGEDAQAANAKFWLGRIHMQQGRNAEAAQMFLRLVEEHPNHSRRADSLVDLSDVLIKLGAADDACNALAEFRRIESDASDRLRASARRISDRARCNLF